MLISAGSVYRRKEDGRLVEVLATTPRVLYSPLGTYEPDFADARIFQTDVESFILAFIEGAFNSLIFTTHSNSMYLGQVA